MNLQTFNFEDACRLANIKIDNSNDALTIRTTFKFLDKSSVGSLLFLIVGYTIGILAVTLANDLFSQIVGGILGFGIGTIALLSVLSQLTNYFQIKQGSIVIRNRLKLTKEQLTVDHKVKMQTQSEFVQLKSQAGSGSYFRVIDIYLSNGKNEKLIIDFQTDEKYSHIANQLGNEITAMVKSKIKTCKKALAQQI